MAAKSDMSKASSALVLSGVASLIFGFVAVFWPGLTLVTLLYIFAAFVLISGIVRIIASFSSVKGDSLWILQVLLGLFELGVGVYLLRHVHVTFATFILLIGFTLIARGLIGVVGAFFTEGASATERTMSIIIGAIALLAGIVVLFQPQASGVAFVWILGLYALVTGAMELAIASDIKKA